jgi:hypothetical protein
LERAIPGVSQKMLIQQLRDAIAATALKTTIPVVFAVP